MAEATTRHRPIILSCWQAALGAYFSGQMSARMTSLFDDL
jgi:hypothetical protein